MDLGIQQDWNRKSQSFGNDKKTSQKHCTGYILYDRTDRSQHHWTGQIQANNTKLFDQQNEKITGRKNFLNEHTIRRKKKKEKKKKVQEKKVEISAQRYLANPKAVSELEIISSRMYSSEIFLQPKLTNEH